MKKGTRTWKLWAAILIYLWLLGIVAAFYGEYILSREVNGFIQLASTVVLMFVFGYCITKVVQLLTRILKRKQLW